MTEARYIEGFRKQALETGRNRLLVTGVVLTLAFTVIAVRLVDLTIFKGGGAVSYTHLTLPTSDLV